MIICAIVDPHYTSNNISSRKDFFPDTMLDKTKQALTIAQGLRCDLFGICGDFSHIKRMSTGYKNKLIRLYDSFPFKKACIIGNHDEYYGNPESVEETSLGTFLLSGVFLPRPGEWVLETEDCTIVFLPYMLELPKSIPVSGNKVKVLFAHCFYGEGFKEDVLPMELTNEFDYILLGHDHDVYDPIRVNKSVILRPGSFSRGTRVKSNWSRGVYMVYLNTTTGEYRYIPLEVLPSEQIFSKEKLNMEKRIKDSKIIDELSKTVQVANKSDVQSMLESMAIRPELKSRAEFWLKEAAIV